MQGITSLVVTWLPEFPTRNTSYDVIMRNKVYSTNSKTFLIKSHLKCVRTGRFCFTTIFSLLFCVNKWSTILPRAYRFEIYFIYKKCCFVTICLSFEIRITFSITISRLPIVQGSTFSYIAPTLALMSLPQYRCPPGFKESKFLFLANVSFVWTLDWMDLNKTSYAHKFMILV